MASLYSFNRILAGKNQTISSASLGTTRVEHRAWFRKKQIISAVTVLLPKLLASGHVQRHHSRVAMKPHSR